MSLEWAERILELRKNLNLSQRGLAELLGIRRQMVNGWEGSDEVTPCWERVLQFLNDCPSSAIEILSRQPWMQGDAGWPERIRMVREGLDWTGRQLAEYMGIAQNTVRRWELGDASIETCNRIVISLLEIYSDVDRKQWPPGLYFQPPDIISEERLRLLRLSLGLKQSQFGNLIRVDRSTVGQWESGRKIPGWCSNLLVRVIETYPRVADLLEKIPWTDDLVSPEKVKQIRGALGLGRLELAHFLGMTYETIATYERVGVQDPGCPALVYLLLEKYPDEFIPLVEGLSNPGGQACPVW